MPYTGANAISSGSGSGWADRQRASFNPSAPSKNTKVSFNDDEIIMNGDDIAMDDDAEDSYSDSESDTSEDSQGEELTPALDAAILRTLGMIKNKEDVVYSGGNVLQEQLQKSSLAAASLSLTSSRPKQQKAYTLQDHQRSALLSASHDLSTLDDDTFHPPSTTIPLSNVQAERALRQEVLSAFHSSVPAAGDDDEEDDGFLSKKEKTDKEVDEEKEAYRKFMLESGGGEEEVRRILSLGPRAAMVAGEEERAGVEALTGMGEEDAKKEKKDKKRRKREKKDDEEFLMNYILNRGWIDTAETYQPTRSEIRARNARIDAGMESADEHEDEQAQGGTDVEASSSKHPWGALEEEDEFDERAEEFETAYNFRFEEPGAAEIPSHPRSIPTLVRRLPEARKNARLTRAERKAEEKAKREEETRRLKGKKRREIQARMEQLREELGGDLGDWEKDGGGFLEGLEEELEGEWDEGKHERMMKRLVGKDEDDDVKPTWDDEDVGEGYEGMEMDVNEMIDGDMETGAGEEDEDAAINMDADFISIPTESKKKRKKSKRGKEKRGEEDVTLDNEEGLSIEAKKEKIKEAVREYEGLDHEDMIGDLPTRFKYAQTAPTSYGLTPAEILLATDAELNQFLGVKNLAPYRPGSGKGDKGMSKRLWELKKELKGRRWGEEMPDEYSGGGQASRKTDSGWKGKRSGGGGQGGENGQGKKKKRMGKKERSRMTGAEGGVVTEGDGSGKRKREDEDGGKAKKGKI